MPSAPPYQRGPAPGWSAGPATPRRPGPAGPGGPPGPGGYGGRGAGGARPPRRRGRSGGVALGVKLIAAGVSLAILVGSGVAWSLYQGFVNDVTTLNLAAPVGSDGKPAPDIDGKDDNILMVGDDSRVGATQEELNELGTTDDGGANNTDTMMVLHVPADGRAATVMSLPRDSWVAIPGHGMGKLNSAFSYGMSDDNGDPSGGASLLAQTIYNVTGITINHFVMIGMLGFLRVANALGGVNLCLNEAQNASTEGDAEHPDGYTGINLVKGWNYDVKGSQAVAFVRQRHGLPGGDLDRIKRQQYFLAAAFRKVESGGTLLNPFKLQSLLHAVSSSLTVDKGLAGSKLLNLAQQMTALTAGNLAFETIPNDGGSTLDDGTSVVQIDTAALPAFISTFLGKQSAYDKAAPAAPSSVSVNVVNDTSGDGADDQAVAALKVLGFSAQTQSSPDVADTTSIEYPAGKEAQAKALAAVVPGAAVSVSSDVSAVTLVLGNDGITVSSGGSTAGGGDAGASSAPPAPAPTASTDVRTANMADCVN